jgi:integrase
MGTVYKETFTKPLPAGAKIIVRKGQRLAEWLDAKGKRRTAPLTAAGDRITVEAGTYTAKYRDGSGIVRKVTTGCRDKTAAESVLADLERRAVRVKGKILTAAEDAMIDHQETPLTEHLSGYLVHLRAKGDSNVHLADNNRLATKIITDCGFSVLADVRREALERWLVQRAAEGMAARTRNSYLQAIRGLCNWCIDTGRLAVNPLTRIAKADETADRRRTRRALTEAELRRLLDVAHRRPLAEYGRLTVRKPKNQAKRKRDTWKMLPLTADELDAATDRARTRLAKNPTLVAAMEALGRERALIYKTLVLTGLRKGELASITVGQVVLDADPPYLILEAADEKNREGSTIPLRADLAADLREWLAEKARAMQEAAREASTVQFDSKHQGQEKCSLGDFTGPEGQSCLPLTRLSANTPLFTVPRALVRILDRDLGLAGIPKRDERGRTVDVHALRHTFGTLLSKGGVAPRTAQAAMRHSKIDLTMNVYTDPKLLDVAAAVEALPNLPLGTGPQTEAAALSATGTEDLTPSPLVPTLVPTGGKPCTLQSILDKIASAAEKSGAANAVAASAYLVKQKDPLTTLVIGSSERGRRESNPQPPDRQSGTLTN